MNFRKTKWVYSRKINSMSRDDLTAFLFQIGCSDKQIKISYRYIKYITNDNNICLGFYENNVYLLNDFKREIIKLNMIESKNEYFYLSNDDELIKLND